MANKKPAPGTPGGGICVQPIEIHGIRTRMVDYSEYDMHHGVGCPCGWRDRWCDWTVIGNDKYDEIVQFHYIYCPKAKYDK